MYNSLLGVSLVALLVGTTGTGSYAQQAPEFNWSKSLPISFHEPGVVRFGGTEIRALVFLDGSLYAGIGDWEDPDLRDAPVAAQVLRLDEAHGNWVEDQNFLTIATRQTDGRKLFQAITNFGIAHFDHDVNKNPIKPVDVLMAGFWNFDIAGMEVGQKTIPSGSVTEKGTWTLSTLVPIARPYGQVRSFGSYTDSVTNQEMAFAGGSPYGVFSGAFNSSTNMIDWNSTGEPGSQTDSTGGHGPRVMSFAACAGKLYASIYDTIKVRHDGAKPSWSLYYKYQGPPLAEHSSGFRGLTCVPEIKGSGSMLIAGLEGPGTIYDIPLDGSTPTIEWYTNTFAYQSLGVHIGYSTAPYNDIISYGSGSCPDLLIGLSLVPYKDPYTYEGWYPKPSFEVRHCDGTYDFRAIKSIAPEIATRTLAVSQFSDDPDGTIYVGGFDAHSLPARNTDWIYRGVPTSAP